MGSTRSFGVYDLEIEWDGTFRKVLVSAVGNQCLLGMKLLRGSQLKIEVKPGGSVEIKKL